MLYVIAGATATGKTTLAIELAKQINGEVISADSMQVYKYMDIGTAKPTEEEKQGIPHHLLDVVNPNEPFSMAEYQKLGRIAIDDILSRNKTPIIAGGTGFYINGLIFGAELSQNDNKNKAHDMEELRQKYETITNEQGAEYLHSLLHKVDPQSAEIIHPNNIKRVIRALSYNKITGKLFSAHNQEQKAKPLLYETKFFVLNMERDILYERINQRTITMWQAGLVDEVRGLLAMGYDSGLAPLQGIGYKETIQFLNGGCIGKEEAIATIQQATRNYAKRQETWFRNKNPSAYLLKVKEKHVDTIVRELLSNS